MGNKRAPSWIVLLLTALPPVGVATAPATFERMAELTFESREHYADPFNDVEVDVVFTRGDRSWRVPAFWRGGQKWTVRFAPLDPATYAYRLESSDRSNPDINGREGMVVVTAYRGTNELLLRGPLRLSANKRYLEHADGTPFYWLGDTWWTGLSDRLPWEGFKRLATDRKAKGFTLVQLVAGLVPYEETVPVDAGSANEGGQVWEAGFKRINPRYFDFADRRISHLIDQSLAPGIVGAWGAILGEMGESKMKQHWRYIVARYGAYPVIWIAGGEVVYPPHDIVEKLSPAARALIQPGWDEIVRYVRATDPYRHLLTVHEGSPPQDHPLREPLLTDFDMIQSGHLGWRTIGIEVAQLNGHYARRRVTKPVVQGEIGYEQLGETRLADFQRAAFWLSMLNGAAGHSYGGNRVFESYGGEKPLHGRLWSFLSWEEGMKLPGAYQVGLGAKLLQQYRWWMFAPRPDWVTPRGTTLLEPHGEIKKFNMGSWEPGDDRVALPRAGEPSGKDNFRGPYAAGIAGEVRFIYLPYFGIVPHSAPTILGLEQGVRYRAALWEPSIGMKIDLGSVERPAPGALLHRDDFTAVRSAAWRVQSGEATRTEQALQLRGNTIVTLLQPNMADIVAAVDANREADARLLLRYRDTGNYVAAAYSRQKQAVYLIEYQNGVAGTQLGTTPVPAIDSRFRLTAEVRAGKGIASISDGKHTYTTPIVDLVALQAGFAGLAASDPASVQDFDNFEVRRSPRLVVDTDLERELRDAEGRFRGRLAGPARANQRINPALGSWESFGRQKNILLDAYRPERLPASGDWVLILATASSSACRRSDGAIEVPSPNARSC